MSRFPQSGPIQLADTSAGQLEVVIIATAMQKQWEASPRLRITFLLQLHGRAVRLVQGEQVQCNGTPLANNDSSFDGIVPLAAQGFPNTCLYQQNQHDTPVRIDFVLAPPPVLLRPQEGETLSGRQLLDVFYQAGPGRDVQVTAFRTAKSPSVPIAVSNGNVQPDTGHYHHFDPRGFVSGPGTLTLTRAFPSLSLDGTAFTAVHLNARCETCIKVTWA